MREEDEYYQELRSQTKTQLLAEIRALHGQIDQRDEAERAEKQREAVGRAANKPYRERLSTIRLLAAVIALVGFGIGYAYSPGLLRLMALAFVIHLFVDFEKAD